MARNGTLTKTANKIIRKPTSAKVFTASKKGMFLLVQRAKDGLWDIAGGGVEPGETPKQGALREHWEETGHIPTLKGLVPCYLEESGGKIRMNFAYCAGKKFKPALSDEHDDFQWVNLGEFMAKHADRMKPRVRAMIEEIGIENILAAVKASQKSKTKKQKMPALEAA